ncbi:hypothetical protein FOPG_19807 [Fusarium oxysporum f. sp. conglutinans race 2 54008]|uniref:Uncharacterized protein n=1 Tax=Fusarium oxysporum f. sp. conglutinans race 2 54008 TaxID=1089457 RepID=X0GVH7_FUSOX|nr:hypothetical protein FOPG_19807 [Fusarium oxysporum f. sp. conglutinans race 2 54008]
MIPRPTRPALRWMSMWDTLAMSLIFPVWPMRSNIFSSWAPRNFQLRTNTANISPPMQESQMLTQGQHRQPSFSISLPSRTMARNLPIPTHLLCARLSTDSPSFSLSLSSLPRPWIES